MKLKMKRSALAVANALACLATIGCGGVDDVSDLALTAQTEEAERRRVRAIDRLAPTISAQSTSTPTSDGLSSLAGVASDDVWLYRVRWRNNRGGSGDAAKSGTKTAVSWSVASIPLQAGTNNITITAEDGAGKTSQVSVTIDWNAAAPAPAPGTAGPRVASFTASGPITASAGQVISGFRIQNPNGPCITVPAGATGVVIRDSDIGPCGGSANIVIEGANATVEYTYVHNGNRGVLTHRTSGTVTRYSRFDTFYGPAFNGTAIEYDYMASGSIEGNVVRGSNYASDAISVFQSSNMRMVNNDIDINVSEPSAAAFTMGDATDGNPGANNYVAGNMVRQTGGVPAGVFGSSGNTVLERNCLSAGIQAYNYSGTFVGVTVRNNVINIGASFVPDTSVISGWSTNINSTDCSRVPN